MSTWMPVMVIVCTETAGGSGRPASGLGVCFEEEAMVVSTVGVYLAWHMGNI